VQEVQRNENTNEKVDDVMSTTDTIMKHFDGVREGSNGILTQGDFDEVSAIANASKVVAPNTNKVVVPKRSVSSSEEINSLLLSENFLFGLSTVSIAKKSTVSIANKKRLRREPSTAGLGVILRNLIS